MYEPTTNDPEASACRAGESGNEPAHHRHRVHAERLRDALAQGRIAAARRLKPFRQRGRGDVRRPADRTGRQDEQLLTRNEDIRTAKELGMARRKMLCERYQAGESCFGNGLSAGRYLAAVSCEPEELPRVTRRDDHTVRHGYGVGFGPHGHWYFFDDIAPAYAFGRAARMALECNAWGIYPAAHELLHCQLHHADERVLHLDVTGDLDRYAGEEVEHLKRFVQGVKEHPWSSNWQPATGYITAYNNGRPLTTRERSLPL